MDGAEVCVLEKADQVRLGRLLERAHSRRLEAQVSLKVLGNFADQALERQLPDQEFGALLELTNIAQGHSARAVPAGLFHAAGGRGGLARGLGSQVLARSFASRAFSGCLLGSGHGNKGKGPKVWPRAGTGFEKHTRRLLAVL